MKTNKMGDAESAERPTERTVGLKDANGIYDHNPDPGLAKYGRSTGGPNEIPIKFAESIGMPVKSNPMTSSVMERNNKQAQKSTTNRVNSKPNRMSSANN